MIWATVSSRSCFCWLYRASPSLAVKNIINLILILVIWWCPCRVFCGQNPISPCPASFCTPRTNFPVTAGVSWLPTFAFQCPIMKRTSFLGVGSKRSCSSSKNLQLQLLQRYWLGHRLGLLWYCMVCLGNAQRSFCHFEIASKYCISDSCWLWWPHHFL